MAAASSSNIVSPPFLYAKLITNLHPNVLQLNPLPKYCKVTSLRSLTITNVSFHQRQRLLCPPLLASEEEDVEIDEQGQDNLEEDGWEKGSTAECKLYVGNLPYSTTSSQLEEIFKSAGHVVSAEVIVDRATDRSRGFAFVTMGSSEEAEAAIKLFNGSQLLGRAVRVNFPEVPKGGEKEVMAPRIRNSYKAFVDSPFKIYAGNLGWRLTSEGLRNAFAEQRGLMGAKVIYERGTGRSRGFGFVSFESAEDAETALSAMDGVEVEGRPLRLNLAADNVRASPSQGNGENDVEGTQLLSPIGA